MTGSSEERDLAALLVPQAGVLRAAASPFEPYQLVDPRGDVVEPVAAFLRDLQARGRPETTQRSYGLALLRWFRFIWAAGVRWDQATRAEARDFMRWLQVAGEPARPPSNKLAQIEMTITRHCQTVSLGMPAFRDVAARTLTPQSQDHL